MKPVEPGNIDLTKRPKVHRRDGQPGYETVRSSSFNIDGLEVLVPTVGPDGKHLTDKQAIDLYKRTGKHLGKFNTPAEASAYAEQLHKEQEKSYRDKPFTDLYPNWDAPQFDPSKSYVKPKSINGTTNRSVLSRIYESVLDSYSEARIKLLKEKERPSEPTQVWGSNG